MVTIRGCKPKPTEFLDGRIISMLRFGCVDLDHGHIEFWSTNFPYSDRFTESLSHDVEQLLSGRPIKMGMPRIENQKVPIFPEI